MIMIASKKITVAEYIRGRHGLTITAPDPDSTNMLDLNLSSLTVPCERG